MRENACMGLHPPLPHFRNQVTGACVQQWATGCGARVSLNFDQTVDQPISARGRGHGGRVEEQQELQE